MLRSMSNPRKSKIIHAAVERELYQELNKYAKGIGVSVSAVIRKALERFLMDRQ